AIVVDAAGGASGLERGALRRRERRLAARRDEVLDVGESEIDRIDGEGGERPVRAPLPGGHLEDREELQEGVPGRGQPLAVALEVADLAGAPVALAAEGEQRHEDPGATRRERVH